MRPLSYYFFHFFVVLIVIQTFLFPRITTLADKGEFPYIGLVGKNFEPIEIVFYMLLYLWVIDIVFISDKKGIPVGTKSMRTWIQIILLLSFLAWAFIRGFLLYKGGALSDVNCFFLPTVIIFIVMYLFEEKTQINRLVAFLSIILIVPGLFLLFHFIFPELFTEIGSSSVPLQMLVLFGYCISLSKVLFGNTKWSPILLVLFFALVFNFYKAIIFCLFVSSLLIIFMCLTRIEKKYRFHVIKKTFLLIFLGVFFLSFFLYFNIFGLSKHIEQQYYDRIIKDNPYTGIKGDITGGRSILWYNVFLLFKENPIFGVGIGHRFYELYGLADLGSPFVHSHSIYLYILYTTGLPCFLFSIILLVKFIHFIFQRNSLDNNAIQFGLIGYLFSLLTFFMVLNPFGWYAISYFFWITVGFIIVLAKINYQANNAIEKNY